MRRFSSEDALRSVGLLRMQGILQENVSSIIFPALFSFISPHSRSICAPLVSKDLSLPCSFTSLSSPPLGVRETTLVFSLVPLPFSSNGSDLFNPRREQSSLPSTNAFMLIIQNKSTFLTIRIKKLQQSSIDVSSLSILLIIFTIPRHGWYSRRRDKSDLALVQSIIERRGHLSTTIVLFRSRLENEFSASNLSLEQN